MPLSGNLRQFALPDILRVIESGQRTGALVLSRGKLRAAIYFSAGQWLLAERIGSSLVLAQHLARVGLITPETFEAAIGIPFAEAGEVPDVQIVRTLIGAHLLNHDDLRTFAVDDAVNLLTIMLGWPDGDFFFEDGTPPPQGRLALPLPVGPLVAQALRYAKAGGVASPVNGVGSVSGANGMHGASSANAMPPYQTPRPRAVVGLDAVLDFAEIDADSGAAVQLTQDQWRFLTAVDGRLPLGAVIQRLQAPEHVILRLAAELLASRVLVVVGSSSGPQTGILPG
ncbi:MAG TPA: DUF4388 domain-containing protein [Ktedonobacterales bacterium]|nr:DUF4388 domain-containing protein [Ktedonobacterales bacterium]